MPQFASMVLKDHAAADHTFVPRDITGGVATAVESTGVPLGEKTASFSIQRTSTGKRKVTMKMVVPQVQDIVVAGISKPTVVRTAYMDITFTFDSTSNTAERQDALAYLKSFLSNTAQIAPVVEDLASPY